MYPKCGRCKQKLKCGLSYDRFEDMRVLIESTKDKPSEVEMNRKGVLTVTVVRQTRDKNSLPLINTVHFQLYKGDWKMYHMTIDCPILKLQLEKIKKNYGY
jgi:hypothetical protein